MDFHVGISHLEVCLLPSARQTSALKRCLPGLRDLASSESSPSSWGLLKYRG